MLTIPDNHQQQASPASCASPGHAPATTDTDRDIFRSIPTAQQIQHALDTDGFIKLEGCLTPQFLAAVKEDVAKNRFGMNRNGLSGVYSDTQYYFCNLLAASRTFVKFVISDTIQNILKSNFADGCRMKTLRYYETYGGHHMQWHTDNKSPKGKTPVPGLILIFYCEDVVDGEFQYIRRSHIWSSQHDSSDFADVYIDKNHANDIVSFPGKAGTLLLANSQGIHRAKPVTRRDYVRKSVQLQIDADLKNGETLMINPSLFAPDAFSDKWICSFLGFGQSSNYAVYPQTDVADLSLRDFTPFIMSFLWKRPIRKLKSLMPRSLKQRLKVMPG